MVTNCGRVLKRITFRCSGGQPSKWKSNVSDGAYDSVPYDLVESRRINQSQRSFSALWLVWSSACFRFR